MTPKKLWYALAAVILLSFGVLGFFGLEIFRTMPPFPTKVVTTDGTTLFEGQDIKDGQHVWQSIGGQTVGSVWGHGAYIAPDWSADYLHREAELLLKKLAERDGLDYASLPAAEQVKYQVLLREEVRKNTFDEATGVITYSYSSGTGRSTPVTRAVGRPVRRDRSSAIAVTSPRVADMSRNCARSSTRSGTCQAHPRSGSP